MNIGKCWKADLQRSIHFSSVVDADMPSMVRRLQLTLVMAAQISLSFTAAHGSTTQNISIDVQTLVQIRCSQMTMLCLESRVRAYNRYRPVFFNRGAVQPKGSANGIEGFRRIKSKDGN